MTTIVNTPAGGSGEEGSNMGLVVGLIILLVIILFVVFYGLPFMRGNGQPSNTAPSNGQSGITVPSKIDVNVNKTP